MNRYYRESRGGQATQKPERAALTLMRRHYSIAEPKLILTPSLRSPRFPSLDRVMPPPLSISPFSDAKGTQHVVHSLGLGRVRGKRRDDLREGPESGRGQRRVNETGDRTDEGETSGQDRISRWRKLCRWLCSCTIHSPDRGPTSSPVRLPSSRAQPRPWQFALICSCSTRRAPTPVHFFVLRFVRRLPSFVRPTICMLGALVANQVNGSQGRRGGRGRPHCNLVFPVFPH